MLLGQFGQKDLVFCVDIYVGLNHLMTIQIQNVICCDAVIVQVNGLLLRLS